TSTTTSAMHLRRGRNYRQAATRHPARSRLAPGNPAFITPPDPGPAQDALPRCKPIPAGTPVRRLPVLATDTGGRTGARPGPWTERTSRLQTVTGAGRTRRSPPAPDSRIGAPLRHGEIVLASRSELPVRRAYRLAAVASESS